MRLPRSPALWHALACRRALSLFLPCPFFVVSPSPLVFYDCEETSPADTLRNGSRLILGVDSPHALPAQNTSGYCPAKPAARPSSPRARFQFSLLMIGTRDGSTSAYHFSYSLCGVLSSLSSPIQMDRLAAQKELKPAGGVSGVSLLCPPSHYRFASGTRMRSRWRSSEEDLIDPLIFVAHLGRFCRTLFRFFEVPISLPALWCAIYPFLRLPSSEESRSLSRSASHNCMCCLKLSQGVLFV